MVKDLNRKAARVKELIARGQDGMPPSKAEQTELAAIAFDVVAGLLDNIGRIADAIESIAQSVDAR